MNGANSPPLQPQVIRHDDGSYSLLNVDLDELGPIQRLALAIKIWDQVRALMEANGLYKQRDPHAPGQPSGIGTTEDIDKVAAALVGASLSSLNRIRPRLLERPDVVEQMMAGELPSVKAVGRALGMRVPLSFFEGSGRSTSEKKSSHYGYSDKFDLALGPMQQYFRAWRKKGFLYKHVNPKEAQRRVKQIDQVMADLAAAREDLVQRSHVASYATPSERRERSR